MKVRFSNYKKMAHLDEVKDGQTFVNTGKVYIKLPAYSYMQHNCMQLSNGSFEKLPNQCLVEVVECELIVRSVIEDVKDD